MENFSNNSLNFLNQITDSNNHGGLRIKNIFKKSEKNKPLISIITAVFNAENYLDEALQSLYSQGYKNYEHIIIDGGSNDKTLDIIKKNQNNIDYWVSQKDKGIYDAFNLGMRLSRGDYIGFLNSDDKYVPDALNILLNYINKYPDKDFIFGSVKKHWGILHGYNPYKIFWSWGFYSSHSTGFFIKKEAAKQVGLYNLKYKYSADYDYFYRMIVKHKMKGIGTKKKELFGIFRRGGFSSRISFREHFFEEISIRLDNNQNRILVLFIFIYKFFKNIRKI
jgi:glycosyltransferase involved in cell wall biosynthesis